MAKLDYLQQKKLNPADELREILSSQGAGFNFSARSGSA
jgi:hypothetical protein